MTKVCTSLTLRTKQEIQMRYCAPLCQNAEKFARVEWGANCRTEHLLSKSKRCPIETMGLESSG